MSFRPTDDDEKLWSYVTKGAKRFLSKSGFPKADVPHHHKDSIPNIIVKPSAPAAPVTSKMKVSDAPQLNRRDYERLRKGQMTIDATIDLHGMWQEQAHNALIDFIGQSKQQKRRCLLVITGKGKISSPSILKQKLPEWLQDGRVAADILKVTSAQPKHGGSGAFYVYLKKQPTD